MKFIVSLPVGGMADRPALALDDSTLCLHVETKASPLLGQFKSDSPCKSATTPTSVSSLSSTSSGPVCYICHCDDTEEPLLRDICGCKKQVVHSKCLATWLHYSAARRDGARAPTCEVCLQELELPLSVTLHARLQPASAHSTVAVPSLLASFGLPGILAFVYGFSYLSLSDTYVAAVYTCLAGNAAVIVAWVLFVVGRFRPRSAPEQQKAVQDVVLLMCVYITFLCGWTFNQWSMPRSHNPDFDILAHFFNGSCMLLGIVSRLAYVPCKACCCAATQQQVLTISLDAEHQ